VDPRALEANELYSLVLGKVIQTLREQRKWTQGELAERIDLAQPQVSRLEAGKMHPDFFLLTRLSKSFGLTLDELRARVERALEIAQKAASAAVPRLGPGSRTGEKGAGWWKVLGFGLLLGAVIVGVAAALEDGKSKEPGNPKPPPKPGGPKALKP